MLLEHAYDVKIGILEALQQHQPLSDITPSIFEAPADVEHVETELVQFLLERYLQALPISSVIVSGLKYRNLRRRIKQNPVLFQPLLNPSPTIKRSNTMLAACHNAEDLQILLSLDPAFPISDEVLEAVVSQQYGGIGLVKAIWDMNKAFKSVKELYMLVW